MSTMPSPSTSLGVPDSELTQPQQRRGLMVLSTREKVVPAPWLMSVAPVLSSQFERTTMSSWPSLLASTIAWMPSPGRKSGYSMTPPGFSVPSSTSSVAPSGQRSRTR